VTRGVQHAALRILVVEDADPVRALVVSALTRDGCAVEEASGVVEARARLSEGRPDVVGEEVLRRLRADPRTSATPVVVLSADATAGQGQR
jgi:CheY-like chemotaxis protein